MRCPRQVSRVTDCCTGGEFLPAIGSARRGQLRQPSPPHAHRAQGTSMDIATGTGRLLSTAQLVDELRRGYPDAHITENVIRGVLRRNEIDPPGTLAGRYVWGAPEIAALVTALGLEGSDGQEWKEVAHGAR